jgi:predicted RNA-binding Zn-ribbon protein involved in translation (DUF1610 family)
MVASNFSMDIRLSEFQNLTVEQAHQAIKCPQCGSPMILTSGRGGRGLRSLQCRQCERLDPLKADEVAGWLRGELRPPK